MLPNLVYAEQDDEKTQQQPTIPSGLPWSKFATNDAEAN